MNKVCMSLLVMMSTISISQITRAEPAVPDVPAEVKLRTSEIHKAAYYMGPDGIYYSNICQTPYQWCSNGRFYPVGVACHCGYDQGVITAE